MFWIKLMYCMQKRNTICIFNEYKYIKINNKILYSSTNKYILLQSYFALARKKFIIVNNC